MSNHSIHAPAFGAKLVYGLAGAVALGLASVMPAKADIKIGFQVPLTGPAATDGKSCRLRARWRSRTSTRPAVC